MSRDRIKTVVPRLLLIADRFTDPRRGRMIERLVCEDVIPWVQLRDHRARRALYRGRGACLIDRLRESGGDLLVSVNTDVELARNLETAIHLGTRGPSVAEARERLGSDVIVGFSAHSRDEAVQAVDEGADYVTFSPVFPTDSKPDHPGVGLEHLQQICAALDEIPVIALGGITPERVEGCLEAGAHGVAVLSGILCADTPAEAAARYLAQLQR